MTLTPCLIPRRPGRHSALASVALLVAACSTTDPSPNASALLGEYSGSAQFPLSRVTVGLLFEEVGDSIRGRWQIRYTISTATDEGAFVGTYHRGELKLLLTPIPGACDGTYNLEARPNSDASVLPVTILPTGSCWNYHDGAAIPLTREDLSAFP